MKKPLLVLVILTTISLLLSASYISKRNSLLTTRGDKGLKDYYKEYFPIGVAVMPSNLKGDEATLILERFNSLTAENSMKMAPIHPVENRYNWDAADSIVAFAQRNSFNIV